jgi:hypothetical protein
LPVKQYRPWNTLLPLPLPQRELFASGQCMMTITLLVRWPAVLGKPLRTSVHHAVVKKR